MEDNVKVFSSTIQRSKYSLKNNLLDLLNIVPAEPTMTMISKDNNTCNFCPNTDDKYYIPKKKSGLKVKTVGLIRKSFEEDTYTYLPSELEKQQNTLLRNIRNGSAGDETTKAFARNILNSGMPISRITWDILINVNPDQYIHSKQFVLWDGKCIQVNGSRGGKERFLCEYDLAYNKIALKNIATSSKTFMNKKKGLLKSSLAIKFKPGPLGKKKYLDDSHQKYHVGDTELVSLPKIGLDIHPTLGTSLESTITCFLNNLRNEDGSICQKWAEFAASVLGKAEKASPKILDKSCVTFELNYKCDQRRILMRRCSDSIVPKKSNNNIVQNNIDKRDSVILPEIKNMMSQILESVEISLNQDKMYTDEDEFRQLTCENIKEIHHTTNTKEKLKRKYCELDRLDVTIIRVPGESKKIVTEACTEPYCFLGCICDSLQSTPILKRHCGRVDCMFNCICDFSKFKDINSLDADCSELIPGLVNLNNDLNMKLAKEEQKFRQTVIVTDEKSILLKSRKRNTKTPKKYADFFKNMSSKNSFQKNQALSITATKLDLANVEPWCMVHNLYRCFCKGKYKESFISVDKETVVKESSPLKDIVSESEREEREKRTKITNSVRSISIEDDSTCSRVNAYRGRKYSNGYYKNTNNKISKMEKNDHNLRERMLNIIYKTIPGMQKTIESEDDSTAQQSNESTNLDQFLSGIDEVLTHPQTVDYDTMNTFKTTRLPNKTKLVSWLESNYKMYKERIDRGINKIFLDPPKAGKVALYPWDFILSRYRERKNLFLISKQKPFRIFMAVNTKSPIFTNCININDIRFIDLHKYPVTVKNLLTNATDLKDNFCILCGLTDCWELIGSVTKMNEGQEDTSSVEVSVDVVSNNSFAINPTWGDKSELESRLNNTTYNDKQLPTFHNDKRASDINVDEQKHLPENIDETDFQDNDEISCAETEDKDDTSKWFVMTVENDFSEIRFYKRGFFVKYESIVKAINVARMSGKTVRLSSQKCVEKSSGPQFGIYAIPNANEYRVFIGPYEIDESLGIETIKTILHDKQPKLTRGFWITTNKVDNLKVIDNPLSFMPLHNSKTVTLSDTIKTINESVLKSDKRENANKPCEVNNLPSTSQEATKKLVKPIKIRKTNGFYHLATNKFLQKIMSNTVDNSKVSLLKLNSEINKSADMIRKIPKVPNVTPDKTAKLSEEKDFTTQIASISPLKEHETKEKRQEKGMFVLKPEEINRKLFENKLSSDGDINEHDQSMNTDIKGFSYEPFRLESPDVYVISDEDEDDVDNAAKEGTNCKKIWIECINYDVGWIHGKKNSENCISFKLPKCEYSDFYHQEKAFKIINNALFNNTKAQCSKYIWKIVESEAELKGIEIKDLDCITTSDDAKEATVPLSCNRSNLKTYCRIRPKNIGSGTTKSIFTSCNDETDAPSASLSEDNMHWNNSIANSTEILNSLTNAPENLKHAMTETLKTIMSMAQDDDG